MRQNSCRVVSKNWRSGLNTCKNASNCWNTTTTKILSYGQTK